MNKKTRIHKKHKSLIKTSLIIPRIFDAIITIYFFTVLFLYPLDQAISSEARVRLSGSSTVGPVVLEIAKRFESLHPGMRIDVATGGSQKGINDLLRGRTDIAMVSRPLKAGEKGAEKLKGLLLARDGLCLIVHKSNPLDALSRKALLSIYRGKTRNWREIGGDNREIVVVTKAEGRATLDVFLAETGLKVPEIAAQVIVGENLQAIKVVAGNKGAIAFISVGAAAFSEKAGAPIKRLSLGSGVPTVENVASGKYTPVRPLLLVVRSDITPSPATRAFLAYALSRDVHDLIVKGGYAPIR